MARLFIGIFIPLRFAYKAVCCHFSSVAKDFAQVTNQQASLMINKLLFRIKTKCRKTIRTSVFYSLHNVVTILFIHFNSIH